MLNISGGDMNALLRAGAILICSQIIFLATRITHHYINKMFPESPDDKIIEGGVDKFIDYVTHSNDHLVASNDSFVDIELN